ncbi:UDP-glucose 4-epimerase GalE [Oceanicella actignis]|uniref:UDP-glucose 4-epimerase GalE n=1 Tax=Oceanicella actignis TaxID=1189325 RepID=UPI0011E7B053|nr:UDP-glucose 4-epimerase GalE [Oceanicella actignis]TYO84881.1 UDP-galactose 4-epimerase [Oceanicella actignis]
MTTLITGGAGYIGSHMALALLDRGERPVILDNLSTGVRALIPARAAFVEGDVGDADLLRWLIRRYGIDEVVHFAGSTVVPESVAQPLAYYRNNAAAALTLLSVMEECGVERLVFSSTAAVYAPSDRPVDEDAPLGPVTPYGASKLMVERMIRDAAAAGILRAGVLRYFNVAGADASGRAGQSTPRATHLIKAACEAACGRRAALTIHGDDWPTPDGTGVRDYIHVQDLIEIHALMLRRLREGGGTTTLNCGYGKGASVRQVIAAVERAAGRRVPVQIGPRRPGDLAQVVARADRVRATLGWRPRNDELDRIVGSALAWEARAGPAPAPVSPS